jgi:hypothetical protein
MAHSVNDITPELCNGCDFVGILRVMDVYLCTAAQTQCPKGRGTAMIGSERFCQFGLFLSVLLF